MENFVAKVNVELEHDLELGVVRTAEGTGILVWLGRDPTEYGRRVTVACDIGDGCLMRFNATTVGNLYGSYLKP